MKLTNVKKFVALHRALTAEKARLEARLAEVNSGLEAFSSTSAAAPQPKAARAPRVVRRRIKNPMSLKKAVTQVTKAKALNKAEILAAIGKLGYRFSGKDPMNSLGVVLYTKGNFKNQDGKFSPLKAG